MKFRTKILGEEKYQPHLHLYMSKEEYKELGSPNRIITCLAQYLEININDSDISYLVKEAFRIGISYIKIYID